MKSLLVLGPGPCCSSGRVTHIRRRSRARPETGMAALETFDLGFVVRISLGRQSHSEDVGQRELNPGNCSHMWQESQGGRSADRGQPRP